MNRKARTVRFVFGGMTWMVLLSLLAAACSAGSPVSGAESPASDKPVLSGTSADPQRVEFQAEDGTKLVGYYYPSKYANASVMILMHEDEGDLCDWRDIALWLQNRLDENPAKLERCAHPGANLPADMKKAWWDSSWFPRMASDASIAVFVFDFRGHGESEAGGTGPDLLKDARAAFKTAAGLKGVDATQIAAVGMSIGADAAADGCLLYNQEMGKGCVGAFSFSPGNYLGMQYSTVVADLAPTAALCSAGELDSASAQACASARRQYYSHWNYPGNAAHGMALIAPGLDPSPMVLIQVFIGLAFGEDVQAK